MLAYYQFPHDKASFRRAVDLGEGGLPSVEDVITLETGYFGSMRFLVCEIIEGNTIVLRIFLEEFLPKGALSDWSAHYMIHTFKRKGSKERVLFSDVFTADLGWDHVTQSID